MLHRVALTTGDTRRQMQSRPEAPGTLATSGKLQINSVQQKVLEVIKNHVIQMKTGRRAKNVVQRIESLYPKISREETQLSKDKDGLNFLDYSKIRFQMTHSIARPRKVVFSMKTSRKNAKSIAAYAASGA